jgi:hypothetical protein
MAALSLNGSQPALSSQWGGLSPKLIASFFAVKKQPGANGTFIWVRDLSQPEVLAPLTDGNIESVQNWQSPFENIGPDQKLSTLSSMIQAGGFSALIAQLKTVFKSSQVLDDAAAKASKFEGRSNLTKLNSTQVFTGSPPLKITLTAHFRAYQDSAREVRDPMNQLMQWALPKSIAADGVVGSLARGELQLYPSEVPQIIGLKYADMLLQPLVIESQPYPLTGPRDSKGNLTHAAVTMSLASLTALDRNDWNSARIL